jgi:hypothetical protein
MCNAVPTRSQVRFHDGRHFCDEGREVVAYAIAHLLKLRSRGGSIRGGRLNDVCLQGVQTLFRIFLATDVAVELRTNLLNSSLRFSVKDRHRPSA